MDKLRNFILVKGIHKFKYYIRDNKILYTNSTNCNLFSPFYVNLFDQLYKGLNIPPSMLDDNIKMVSIKKIFKTAKSDYKYIKYKASLKYFNQGGIFIKPRLEGYLPLFDLKISNYYDGNIYDDTLKDVAERKD